MRQTGSGLLAKRIFDVAASAVALILASPVIAAISLTVLVRMGRPVFFLQERPGRNEQPFRMIKFRTMRHDASKIGEPQHDASRLTTLGSFLRATSLDELPELWNVLTGRMSLVGPRPLLMKYLPRYSVAERRRHDVLPGLTGWAQINGRNATTWDDRFKHDVWYVDNWSFWLDMRIILLTISAVLLRRGVSQEGHATMPEFTGGTAPDGTA